MSTQTQTETPKAAAHPDSKTDKAETPKKNRHTEPSAAEAADMHLPLSAIIVGENVRFELPDIAQLKESIQAEGILQPLIVRPHKDKDGNVVPEKFDLMLGNRRFAAAKQLHLKTVPVRIVEADDNRRTRIALIENVHRADMNPLEKATAIQKVITDDGIDQKTAAKSLGVTEGFISQHLALLKLPKQAQNAVRSEKIDLTQARELYRMRDHEEKMLEFLSLAPSLTTPALKTKVDLFLQHEKEKAEAAAEREKTKARAKKSKSGEEGEDEAEAAPSKPGKKSLAEIYAETEFTPLKKTAMRETLQAYALKMENAKSEDKRIEYKFILKGMEIAAGLKEA